MSDNKKEIKILEKIINKEQDSRSFSELNDSDSFEEFILLRSKRDYVNNMNNQNSDGRGSDVGTGSYLSKELFKGAIDSVCENMSKYINKKTRNTSLSKFFMMNTTFMNLEETDLCIDSIKSATIIACKILIDDVMQSTKYQLIESKDKNSGLSSYNNYIKVLSTYKRIGNAILEEQIINSVLIQQPNLAKSLLNRSLSNNVFNKFNQLSNSNDNIKCILKNGKNKNGDTVLNVNQYDKNNDIIKIGAFFVHNIINSNDNVFEITKLIERNKTTEMIGLKEEFLLKITEFENLRSISSPKFLPKPIRFGEPKQWDDFDGGSFFNFNVDFIKNIRPEIKRKLIKEEYSEVFKAANCLQNTVFSVNNTVLNTIIKLTNSNLKFRNKKGKLILPYRAGLLSQELPKLPSNLEDKKEDIKSYIKERNNWYNKNTKKDRKIPDRLDIKKQSISFQNDYNEYKEHQVKVRLENEFLKANMSKYSSLIQSIDIAKIVENEKFYLTTQIDWRIRYYYSCVFSPQTTDCIKGMLQFGNEEYVSSKDDIYFLFNCGANDYGNDKLHPDMKNNWVNDNIEIIAECGRNPLDNINFWGEADKPFMFLNFCTEIAQYLDNGRKFINSKYICFFDGSCNGTQHFAGMTGGRRAALLTNLTDVQERHDLYSVVAAKTKQLVEGIRDGLYKDILKIETDLISLDIKIKDYYQEHSSEALEYGIDRKLVKQNVMTMTYGATPYGRKDQVQSVYKEVINSKGKLPFPQESIGYKSSLVSSIAFGAITLENPDVVSAMKWLTDCTSVFSEVEYSKGGFTKTGFPMKWKSVIGATIHQEYFKTDKELIEFTAAKKCVYLYSEVQNDKVDREKSLNGIIANVTHNQDATHMTLTINECDKHFKGFASVHDSFGASVKNASKLYNIVRYTFSEMYHDPYLENLYNQWYEQLSGLNIEYADKLPKPPAMGDYKANECLNNPFCFI